MSIDTGGPAFPVPDSHHANGQVQYGSDGMTLRDYFAAKAMLGLINVEVQEVAFQERIAKWAYEIAEAMLEARGQE